MERVKSLTGGYELSNGIVIPSVGFGTFRLEGIDAEDSVKRALEAGYRLIDTASVYGNEEAVGKAVRESGVPREEILVTTKVWNSDQGYKSTKEAFQRSMEKLGLGYIDIYLIHWPIVGGKEELWAELNRQTWKAMEEFYKEGLVKTIGVSNFKPHHIESLLEAANVKPMLNQIELYPGWMQEETVEYCNRHGIIVEAWSPISHGNLLQLDIIKQMAKKYDRTSAQIALRWHVQKGQIPLPKSVTPERIVENSRIFDFELTWEDMAVISDIKELTGSGKDSDNVAYV